MMLILQQQAPHHYDLVDNSSDELLKESGNSSVRLSPESIELEYKLRMTRIIGDEEIRARFRENLVDRYLAMERRKKREKEQHRSMLNSSGGDGGMRKRSGERYGGLFAKAVSSNSGSWSIGSAYSASRFSGQHHHYSQRQQYDVLPTNTRKIGSTTRRANSQMGGVIRRTNEDDDEENKMYDPTDRRQFVHSAPVNGGRTSNGIKVKFSTTLAQSNETTTTTTHNKHYSQEDLAPSAPITLTTNTEKSSPQSTKKRTTNNTTTNTTNTSSTTPIISPQPHHHPTSAITLNEPPPLPSQPAQSLPLEKIEINNETLKELTKTERDRLYASLADLRAKLKRIDDEEAKTLPQRDESLSSASAMNKTIMRMQKPKSAKSMSVDKWIEVHKRRNGRNGGGESVMSRNERMKMLNEKLKEKLGEHEAQLPPATAAAHGHHGDERKNLKFRSRRELSDLTVLDKIQSRIRLELEENLKNLRKLESQNEFNSIVAKIREFLCSEEKSRDKSVATSPVIITPKSNVIRVYEYNMF